MLNSIDGRVVSDIGSTFEYMQKTSNMSGEEFDKFVDENEELYSLLSKTIALVYSHKLLRHTRHTCQSLSDAVDDIVSANIHEMRSKYKFEFQINLFQYY